MKYSSKITFALVLCATIVTKCYENDKKKEVRKEVREKYLSGYYDNVMAKSTKIEIAKTNKFIPPESWNQYIVSNHFFISVPPTVELRNVDDVYTQEIKKIEWHGHKINEDNVVFQQKGLSANSENAHNTYCRIIINIQKGNSGDFMQCNEFEDLELEDIHFFQSLAIENSSGYEVIGTPSVRWVRIEDIYAIEVEYTRKGVDDNRTNVNSYYLFNDSILANIILSYRQKDANLWEKDFSNVIRTFTWNNK